MKHTRFILFALFLIPTISTACSVPVFRYALERWHQDNYQVFVFYDEDLEGDERQAAHNLSKIAAEIKGNAHTFSLPEKIFPPANISVTYIDVSAEVTGFPRMVWQVQKNPPLPWVVVRYPRKARIKEDLWAGILTDLPRNDLIQSPKRRELCEQLIGGESVVWVMVECGNKGKDKKALSRLRAGLDSSMNVLELPEMTEKDIKEYLSELRPEVRKSFSYMVLSADDRAEDFFRSQLIHSEPVLGGQLTEPVVFPVFGRGRSLYGLSGKGINTENILDANGFLVGPCACTVKEGNPGVDLMTQADWGTKKIKHVVEDEPMPALQGFEKFLTENQ